MVKRILFIEDEMDNTDGLVIRLSDHPVECHIAIDGDKAIEYLSSIPIDLVCLDIMFPSGDGIFSKVNADKVGLELLGMIRNGRIANCPSHIAVLILTARSDFEVEKACRKLNVIDYFNKPEDPEVVLQTIIKYLEL
jgi:DNA-binding response OmpR family regulator